MGGSVGIWKTRKLRAAQKIDACLVKTEREVKRLYQGCLLFLVKILSFFSPGVEESAVIKKRLETLKSNLWLLHSVGYREPRN